MADGLSTISALLRERGRNGIRSLKREFFLDTEQPAYDLLMSYYRQHGELPPPEVFQRAGIVLPQTDAAFSYFLDQIGKRAIFNTSRDFHAQLSEALRNRDTDRMVEITRQVSVQVGTLRSEQSIDTAGRVVADVIEDYTRVHENADLRGISTGWDPLDELTAGWQGGDLIVVLARRGMGKTYAMIRSALQAWNEGYSVLFVTMEMTMVQIVRRMVAIRAGLNPDLVRRGMLTDRALHRLRETANLFRSEETAPFWLLPGSFNKTTADVDNLVQEFRPDIVFIDGSYLLKPQLRQQARWEIQGQLHEELKSGVALARDVPVVCSVQVSRQGGKSKSGDGIAAGSDIIEQVASIMVRIQKGQGRFSENRRRYDLVKNRDGRLGRFTTHFEFDPLNMEVDDAATEQESLDEDQRDSQRDSMVGLNRDMA